MGAVENLQKKYGSSQDQSGVHQHASSPNIDVQLAWHQMSHLYVSQVHEGWWDQMPMGQSIAVLQPFKHAHLSLVEHLDQLFKIEKLGDYEDLRVDIAELGLLAFQDWLGVAQQLGLMMLSVPLSMEIDGKLKLQYTESFGAFAQNITEYATEDAFQQFYQCITYKRLRLILESSSEQLLRESSFQAWALISLILPKGITQRVHLTIPSEWVAEIQELRNRFTGNEALQSIKELMPVIASRLVQNRS